MGNQQRIKRIASDLIAMGHTVSFFRLNQHRDSPGENSFFNGSVLKMKKMEWRLLSRRKRHYKRLNSLIKLSYLLESVDNYRYNQSLKYYYRYDAIVFLRDHLKVNCYDYVLVNYATNAYLLKLFPSSTHKIIDTHDVMANRYRIFTTNGLEPRWQSISRKGEKAALELADTVWAITKNDESYFKSLLRNVKVQLLPHYVPFKNILSKNNMSVLFVGADNPWNKDGIIWFIGKIWNSVSSVFPKAKLIVCGSICRSLKSLELVNSVKLYGEFDPIEKVYHLSNICINPVRFGTGTNIKSIEALSKGKLLISTKVGVEGVSDFKCGSLFVSDEIEDWTSYILNPKNL